MAPRVTRSYFKSACLGFGGTGNSHHGYAAGISAATATIMSIYTKIGMRNEEFSSTSLNLCLEELS